MLQHLVIRSVYLVWCSVARVCQYLQRSRQQVNHLVASFILERAVALPFLRHYPLGRQFQYSRVLQ